MELVEEAKKYHLDIVGVSFIVDLDGGWKVFYSGADPNMFAQAGVEIILSSQTVCSIGFFWDYGSVC